MKKAIGIGVLMISIGCAPGWCLSAAGATITSDELELRDNGELTIFSGHVVLKQEPYKITADRMVRPKATEIVDASGRVTGNWLSAKHEKVRVASDYARYNPTAETIDLWGSSRVKVQLEGPNGKASFVGDQGWASTHQPGKARLSGHVTGHVIPAP